MLDFRLSLIKGTNLFFFGFYKIKKIEFAMDDIASILINTALSKNDFTPLLPDDWKTYFSKFIFKNIIQKEKGWEKKKLDNQNVHNVPFK